VTELAAQIDEHRAHIEAAGTLEERRARNLRNEVLGIAASRMRRRLEDTVADDPEVAELLAKVVSRETDPATAAGRLLEREGDG
jgi:LAO/AO transport system kinase